MEPPSFCWGKVDATTFCLRIDKPTSYWLTMNCCTFKLSAFRSRLQTSPTALWLRVPGVKRVPVAVFTREPGPSMVPLIVLLAAALYVEGKQCAEE